MHADKTYSICKILPVHLNYLLYFLHLDLLTFLSRSLTKKKQNTAEQKSKINEFLSSYTSLSASE
jgi:hypothetical protein